MAGQPKQAEIEAGAKNPLLEESQGPERAKKFLILGARREGGQMAVIGFAENQGTADAQAGILTQTGWSTVEVYTRVAAHNRK